MAEKAIRATPGNEEHAALVAFTTLEPLAAGGLVGLLVVSGSQQYTGINWAALTVLSIGLLALVASLFHLGRPWRAPLALRKLSTSWLSREVLLFGLFLVALTGFAILPVFKIGGLAVSLIGYTSAILGLLATIASGETYRLLSRPAWDHWSAVLSFPLGALSAGTLLGLFIARQFAGYSQVGIYVWVVVALILILTLIVSWLRSIGNLGSQENRLSRLLVVGPLRWLLFIRSLAVLAALVLIGIGGEAQVLAWIPAVLGELADRALFFNSIVPVSLKGHYIY
jgi:anaerobic dimethyl sulfoxide reductase subunit C